MSVCASVCGNEHMSTSMHEGQRCWVPCSHRGSCEPPGMGAGNWTWVLWKYDPCSFWAIAPVPVTVFNSILCGTLILLVTCVSEVSCSGWDILSFQKTDSGKMVLEVYVLVSLLCSPPSVFRKLTYVNGQGVEKSFVWSLHGTFRIITRLRFGSHSHSWGIYMGKTLINNKQA